MKVYTVTDINAHAPCRPATHWVAENWSGTIQDILALVNVSDQVKIWIVCRLFSKVGRVCFAYWCAQRARNHATDVTAATDATATAAYAAADAYAATAAAYATATAAAYAASDAATAAYDYAYATAAYAAERAAQVKFLKENIHD